MDSTKNADTTQPRMPESDHSIRLISAAPTKAEQTISQRYKQSIAEALKKTRPKPVIKNTHNAKVADLPPGDVLIHAGDLSRQGSISEIQEQLDWLSSLKEYRHKIVIAGNHDRSLRGKDDSSMVSDATSKREAPESVINPQTHEQTAFSFGDLTYLCDTSVTVTINDRNLTIHGTPWTPEYGRWEFTYSRGIEASFWKEKIPNGVDIVVAHGPPKDYLDTAREGRHVGSLGLLKELQRVRPGLLVCGHIHDARGRVDVVLDSVSSRACSVINAVGGGGGPTLMGRSMDAGDGGSWMNMLALLVSWLWAWGKACVTGMRDGKVTVMVNAACEHPRRDEEARGAFVVVM